MKYIVHLCVNYVAVTTISIQKFVIFHQSFKQQYSIPEYESVFPHLEKEFNCKIVNIWDDQITKIYFETEKQLNWFLLQL